MLWRLLPAYTIHDLALLPTGLLPILSGVDVGGASLGGVAEQAGNPEVWSWKNQKPLISAP